MLDYHDEFFLGKNVNEPVAIEIPVRVKDIRGLGDFLTKLGFEITYDGSEKGKILIDTIRCDEAENVITYSIITPALEPQERLQFYSVLRDAIEEYIKICKEQGDKIYNRKGFVDKDPNMFYPHLLDLKHLVADSSNIGKDTGQGDEIEKILDTLERSGEVHTIKPEELGFWGIPGNPLNREDKNYFHGDMEKLFPHGYLYSGSAIPDPYSVATGFNSRFIRFATTNPKYAASLTGVDHKKSICGYQNLCPKGKRTIGFIYQYQYNNPNNRDEQLRFNNAGIEQEEKSYGYEPFDNETAINRFDNPCVGTYLMWGDVDNPSNLYIYKIDENDPRYQIIKNYYKPANSNLHDSKRARFETWNAEGDNHQTYMPIKEGNLDLVKSNIEADIQERNLQKQTIAEQQQRIKDIEKLISNVHSELLNERFKIFTPKIPENLSEIVESQNGMDRCQQNINEYEIKLKEISKTIDDIKSEISSNEYLKKYEFTEWEKLDPLLKTKQTELATNRLSLAKYSNDYAEKKEEIITDNVNGDYEIMRHEAWKLTPDIRKQLLLKYKELVDGLKKEKSAQNLINIYVYSQKEEKAEMFDLLCQIRQKMPDAFRKTVKKRLEDTGMFSEDEGVLTELFSRDFLFFVKRVERAKKLMKIRMVTMKLNREMQNTNGNAVENTSRDM